MHGLTAIAAALRSDRRGVTVLEYGLIAAAIIVAISTTVFSLGSSLNTQFGSVKSDLTAPAAAAPPATSTNND